MAEHYKTVFVPEFARAYIENLDRPYNQADILKIAKGQIKDEENISKQASGILFCDTELIVTKIWSDVKYGVCDPWIISGIGKNKYDLFLLCNIDIPWQADPQREHPHMREKLFGLYYLELAQRGFPFKVVSGLGKKRLKNAIDLVEANFTF